MDKLKKKRTPVRSAFTKTANIIQQALNEDTVNKENVQLAMDMLEKKAEELVELNQQIMDVMIDGEATDEEINDEYESVNGYEAKLFLYRRKVEKLLKVVEPRVQERGSEDDHYGTIVSQLAERKEKKYKLPKIEFAKFNGDIKEWLAFWAQFQSRWLVKSMVGWIGLHPMNQHTASLHIFSDASKLAYNASVFLRIDDGSDVKVQLIQAKTRIAPIKKLSINRLELLGCVISTRLANTVKKDVGVDSIECVYWTDSANALHWITHDDQWGIYVWNKVTEIRKSYPIGAWRHIPGELNPADLPSRGCKASKLLESGWWEGPDWLKSPKENWPKSTAEPNQDVYDEKKNVVIANWECSKDSQHAKTQTLMAILREKFWIIRSRETVSKVVKKCFVCNWYAAKPFETPPAQLPLERMKDASTFEVTGVDLTGHIYLEDGTKAWIVLYTCAVYRTISLDVVTSLTTDAYMQSLRRFIADKRRPKIMYSDHGTNLTGTENLLKEIDWEEIQKRATAKRIDWRFIPSKAPWWGGFWERLIGIVKDLLKRVLGKAKLDYDEIRTLVCETAAIVNARPMTYMASDPSELEALSPSMFLKDMKEEGTPDLDNVNAKKFNERLQYLVHLKEELRKRFRSEYMSQLVHRKGANATRSIELGELVLISNENQKRFLWPIAKVVELIPSKDGMFRVVKVKTSKGILERPVKLLTPLEIRQNEEVSTLGILAEYRKEIESVTNGQTKKKSKSQASKPKAAQPKQDSNAGEAVTKITRSGRVVKGVQRLGV